MRNKLSVIVSLVFLLSMAFNVGVQADETVWNYVYTAEDLYAIRENLTANYVLMADINLSDATAVGGVYDHNGNGWLPIGANNDYTATDFTGIFDGNGHTIRGLRVDLHNASGDASKMCVGLFGSVSGTVKNVTVYGIVAKTVVSKRSYAGAVVGYSTGTIENCVSFATVYNCGPNSYAGGICGNVWNGSIMRCANHGSVTAEYTDKDYYSYAGGIVGYAQSATITDCFNEGTISGRADNVNTYFAGGICGNIFESEIQTCYHVGHTQKASRATGITAITGGTVVNSYCLEGRGNAVTGVTALSEEQMAQQSSYNGFDFIRVWKMAEGYIYPVLQAQHTLSGDINGDNSIDMSDAYSVYLAASTGEQTLSVNRSGDVNRDGAIDMVDAYRIYRIASGEL